MKHKTDKRAISGVVTTILLVLLALVAILIIWGVIQPFLKKSAGGLGDITECLDVNLEITNVKVNIVGSPPTNSYITVHRSSGGGEIKDLKFTVAGNLRKEITTTHPSGFKIKPLETITYFYTSGSLPPPIEPPFIENGDEVQVAAVVETADGGEKLCSPASYIYHSPF